MKKILRPILCGGVLAALLCTPSLAAEQGDFSLLVNGEPVTFTDAAPVLKDGRSFLPAVTTFQALGFAQEDIVWDGETQTVTASKDGAAISLTVGDSAVTWTAPSWSQTSEDGTSGSAGGSGGIAYLDTAPYIDPATNRTYIPVGLVADILGCRVALDAETYTVIIDDVDAILAENTETYELMDQYLDYARKYSQGNYQVEGSYLLTSAPGEMESGVEIIHTVGGDYSLISSQTAMQLDLGVSIGGTIMGAPISPTDMDLDMRADLDTGMLYLYFQSEDLEQLMNNNVQINGETIEFQIPDQWYSLDMKAVYDEAYGPGFYEELLALNAAGTNQEATFAQTLEELLKSDTLTLTSTATTSDYLEALNQLLGDSHFQKSGSTYTSTPIDLEEDGSRILVAFQLYTSGGKVNGYGLEMTIADTEGTALALTAEMRDSKMEMLMDFQMPGELSMTMEIDGAYQRTSTAPTTEPPAGATVVDLMDALTGDIAPAPEPEAA